MNLHDHAPIGPLALAWIDAVIAGHGVRDAIAALARPSAHEALVQSAHHDEHDSSTARSENRQNGGKNNVITFVPSVRPSIGQGSGGGQAAPLPKPRKDKRTPRRTGTKDAPVKVLDYLANHPADADLSVTALWEKLHQTTRIRAARSTVGKARRIFLTDGRE